jgi:hypothetical protein
MRPPPPAGTLAAMNTQSPGPRPSRPQRAQAAAVITILATAALLTAACGGSSSSSTGSGASPDAARSATSPSGVAFARCVRSHGIPNFPDPIDSSGHFSKTALRQLGVSDSRLRTVEDACQSLLPAGPAPLTAQDQQDYLRAAACMRAHGVTSFPDPVFSSGSVSFPTPPAGFNTSSPQFVQARQICQRLIPAGLPYSGSGSRG